MSRIASPNQWVSRTAPVARVSRIAPESMGVPDCLPRIASRIAMGVPDCPELNAARCRKVRARSFGKSCLSSLGVRPRSASSLGESCPANHACPRSACSFGMRRIMPVLVRHRSANHARRIMPVLVRLDHACPRSACGESCLSSFGSPRSACFRHAANHACTRSARSACSLGESCPANHACPRSACSHSVRSSFGSFHRIEATVAAHDWPDTGSVRPQAWVGLPRFS